MHKNPADCQHNYANAFCTCRHAANHWVFIICVSWKDCALLRMLKWCIRCRLGVLTSQPLHPVSHRAQIADQASGWATLLWRPLWPRLSELCIINVTFRSDLRCTRFLLSRAYVTPQRQALFKWIAFVSKPSVCACVCYIEYVCRVMWTIDMCEHHVIHRFIRSNFLTSKSGDTAPYLYTYYVCTYTGEYEHIEWEKQSQVKQSTAQSTQSARSHHKRVYLNMYVCACIRTLCMYSCAHARDV